MDAVKWIRRWLTARAEKRRESGGEPAFRAAGESRSSGRSGAALDPALQILVRDRFQRLLLGEDAAVTQAPPSVPERLLLQIAEQQLATVASRQAAIPRLPAVVPLLLQRLRDPDSAPRDFAPILQRDPPLAAAVLKTAGSVWFNPYRKVLDNFERVVIALGADGLRLAISSAVFQPILQRQGQPLTQLLWDHARITAACSHHLARRTRVDRFHAYLAGLLLNVGAVTVCDTLRALNRSHFGDETVAPHLLRALLASRAAVVSYWIVQDWDMPAEVVAALGQLSEKNGCGPLAELVDTAATAGCALMCHRHGMLAAEELRRITDALGLEANAVDTLLAELSPAPLPAKEPA